MVEQLEEPWISLVRFCYKEIELARDTIWTEDLTISRSTDSTAFEELLPQGFNCYKANFNYIHFWGRLKNDAGAEAAIRFQITDGVTTLTSPTATTVNTAFTPFGPLTIDISGLTTTVCTIKIQGRAASGISSFDGFVFQFEE